MTTVRSIAEAFEEKFVTLPLQRQQYRDWLAKRRFRTRQVVAAGEVLEQLAQQRQVPRRR